MGRGRSTHGETVRLTRSSGVLLHPTSLPSGRLDADAYAFVDWLVEAGQSFWQVLPLVPPDKFASPYAGLSAFAGWRGFLAKPDAPVSARAEADFRRRNAYWIEDWAERSGRSGEVAAQVRFDREWAALRAYASRRGIRIFGDLPLYVDRKSVDVAIHPSFFDLSLAAGVPPDAFTRWGQLWGSPTYRWSVLRKDGYRWWIERFRRSLQLFDLIRLDHFRGFVAYWAVRYGLRTARKGRWFRGPGLSIFDAVHRELGPLPIVAEDLGVITPPVDRLRETLGAPGMHILQWAFSPSRQHHDALENHREYAVVYTGTHDNDTAAGWWATAKRATRERVEAERVKAGIAETDPAWVLVELALSSRSRLAMLPLQDVLGLGNEARMNLPATFGQNWQWRLEPGELTRDHARRLREATSRWRRLPG